MSYYFCNKKTVTVAQVGTSYNHKYYKVSFPLTLKLDDQCKPALECHVVGSGT